MVFGKIVAGLLGLLVAGWPGLFLGLLLGHSFDRALGGTLSLGSEQNLQRIRDSFFETTFLLCGHLAKADGRVSEQEIAHTEQMFVEMGLDSAQRKRAIGLFRRGAEEDFQPAGAVESFVQVCRGQRQLQQTLLLFLVSLAHADNNMEPAEYAVLVRVAGLMGISAAQLDLLLQMARAQGQFHQGAGDVAPGSTAIEDAYAALGVDSGVSDRDLKRAYRKRMSENHPDKLIAKGVPEEMVKLATERSQEIQAAYELLRKQRGA